MTFYRGALSQLSGDGEVTQEGENFPETQLGSGQQLGIGINPAGPGNAMVEFAVTEAQDVFPLSDAERAFIATLGVPGELQPPAFLLIPEVALSRSLGDSGANFSQQSFVLAPDQIDPAFEYYRTLFESGGGAVTLNDSDQNQRTAEYEFPGQFLVRVRVKTGEPSVAIDITFFTDP